MTQTVRRRPWVLSAVVLDTGRAPQLSEHDGAVEAVTDSPDEYARLTPFIGLPVSVAFPAGSLPITSSVSAP